MASATIDTLQVKISASATDAAKALDSLANALKKVRNALGQTGKDGQNYGTKISRNLTDLHNAINKIDTDSVKKLNQLSSALNRYSAALGKIKNANVGAGVAGNIGKIKTALDVPMKEDTESSPGGSWGGESPKDLDEKVSRWERLETISEKLGAKIRLLKERVGSLGKTTKKTSDIFSNFIRSIGRIALYRAIRSALKAITEAFSEGLKNAYLWSKQSEDFTRLAEALDHLKSVTSQMVNQLGAFAGEFKQFIMPAVNWIIEKVRYLAEKLTELFAALNGQDTYQFARLQALEWEEATEEAKKYKQQLLGIDELNNLTTSNNSNSKADNIKDAFEIKNVSEQFKAIGTAWQGLKEKVMGYFDEIFGELTGPICMGAIGALLLFTGHPLIGLGLILGSVVWSYEKLKWNDELRTEIEEKFKKYEDLFKIGSAVAIAIGTILLFVPGKWLLGLGLIVSGTILKRCVDTDLNFDWEGLKETIRGKFKDYKKLFKVASAAAIAVGAILLFVPGHRLLGLGLLIAGGFLKKYSKEGIDFSWDGLRKTINQKFEKYKSLFAMAGTGLAAVGATLLFVPGKRALGLGLILAGTAIKSVGEEQNLEWDELFNKLEEKFKAIYDLFKYGSAAMVAIGALLLFVPGMEGLGLSLIKDGLPGLFVAASDVDWDSVLKSLKTAWGKIEDWWYTNVKGKLNKAANFIEKTFNKDFNGDGKIGGLTESFSGKTTTEQSTSGNYHGGGSFNLDDYEEEFNGIRKKNITGTGKSVIRSEAIGGINKPGTLFFAGESGTEFVGNMGNSSAVANTEQMTDAIYKAAYMGMSRALQENGGNGMNGFVPATTDDLFIAMRKKASNYNKMTGNSAFA